MFVLSCGCYDADLGLGDVAFADGMFVAVGQLHPYDTLPGPTAVFASQDGEAWQRRQVGADEEAVRLSNVDHDGVRWIAVGAEWFTAQATEEGYPERECLFVVSTDGEEWTVSERWQDETYRSVASGNGLLVVTSWRDSVRVSADGEVWSAALHVFPEDFQHQDDVMFGHGQFIIPGEIDDQLRFVTSVDGIDWAIEDAAVPEANTLYGASFVNDTFVAGAVHNVFCEGWGCGDEDDFYAATSPDGLSWTLTESEIETRFENVAFGNGTFVAQWSDGLAVSQDGAGWEVVLTPPPRTYFGGVAFGSGRFVAVGSDSAWISTDGREWRRSVVYEE